MAGIGERLKGLLLVGNPAVEGSAKSLADIEAMSRDDNKSRSGFATPTETFEDRTE